MQFRKAIFASIAVCAILATCTGCKDKYDDYLEDGSSETRAVTTTAATTTTTEPIEEKTPELEVEDQKSKKIEIDSSIAKKDDDGRIILDVENDNVEISTTKSGDTIAIIQTTNDDGKKETVKVAVIVDEETGETIIDPTKTVITIDDEDIVENVENLIIVIDDQPTTEESKSSDDEKTENSNSTADQNSKSNTTKDPTVMYINITGPEVSTDLVSILSDLIEGRASAADVPESIKGIVEIIKSGRDNTAINVVNKSDGSKVITVTVTTNIVKTEGANIYVEQVETVIKIVQPPVKYVPTDLVIIDDNPSNVVDNDSNTPKVTDGPKTENTVDKETTTTTSSTKSDSKKETTSEDDDTPKQVVDPNNDIVIPVETKTPVVTTAPTVAESKQSTTAATTAASQKQTPESQTVETTPPAETQAPTVVVEPGQPNIIHLDSCAHYHTSRKYKTFTVKAIDPEKLKEYVDEDCKIPIRYGEWTFKVYEGLCCNECGEWLEKYSLEFDDSDDVEYIIYNVADTSNITLDEAIVKFVKIKKII